MMMEGYGESQGGEKGWREWTAALPDMTQQRRLQIYKLKNKHSVCLCVVVCIFRCVNRL